MSHHLPAKVRTFRSATQVRTIRVYDDTGKQMSPAYMRMFRESRILPREPYNDASGQRVVDVVEGKIGEVQTRRKDGRSLADTFLKRLRAGLVLTPVPVIIAPTTGRVQREKVPTTPDVVREEIRKVAREKGSAREATREARGKHRVVIEDASRHARVRRETTNRRQLVFDELRKFTTGTDEHHNVYFKFYCEKGIGDGSWKREEYSHTAKLTVPLIRALIRFATTRKIDKLVYRFGGKGVYDYTCLTDWLRFVAGGKSKSFLHTPDELRSELKTLIETLDRYMTVNSSTMSTMTVKMSQGHLTFAQFAPPAVGDLPLALASGRYFYSRWLVNDISLVSFDDELIRDFESHTRIEFRPNSCLATLCLFICFAGNGRPVWAEESRWTEARAAGAVNANALPVPDYVYLSELCGVPFGADGSLRLTLNQIRPFLEKYRTHCYVLSTDDKKVYEFIHPRKKTVMPILRLIVHHEHVRMVNYRSGNQSMIQTFDAFFKASQLLPPPVSGERLLWDTDDVSSENGQRFNPFLLRKQFKTPALCLKDLDGTKAAEHALLLCGEMERVADESQEKTTYVVVHHFGELCPLLTALKANHGVVGGRITIGRSDQGVVIRDFKIKHLNVIFAVGNALNSKGEMTGQHEQDASAAMDTVEGIERFNRHYQPLYEMTFNRNVMSCYAPKWLSVVKPLRCAPLAFCVEEGGDGYSIDANKAYTTTLLHDIKVLPVFDEGCCFVQCPIDSPLEDYSLYVVETIAWHHYSPAERIIFDRSVCLYYGKVLKRARELVELPFLLRGVCHPRRLVSIDYTESIKRLYTDEEIDAATRKTIVNCFMGSMDKMKHVSRSGEWFANEQEANSRLCKDARRINIAVGIGSVSEELAAAIEADTADEAESWRLQNDALERSRETIYVNVDERTEYHFSEGFLPVSQLKYQFQRLRVLASWLQVEQSKTLVPIGVKTDAIFVRRKNAR